MYVIVDTPPLQVTTPDVLIDVKFEVPCVAPYTVIAGRNSSVNVTEALLCPEIVRVTKRPTLIASQVPPPGTDPEPVAT